MGPSHLQNHPCSLSSHDGYLMSTISEDISNNELNMTVPKKLGRSLQEEMMAHTKLNSWQD